MVSRVIVDPAMTSVVPTEFSSILRRELELSLQSTSLFTIPARDEAELERILDEIQRTRSRGARATNADVIVIPTIVAYELTQRRRQAPFNEGRDLVTPSGSLSLQISVVSARSDEVLSRFPLSVSYRGEGRTVDREGSAGTSQAHPNDYVGLSREAGRALAEHVRSRNPRPDAQAASGPILVAERIDNRVWLTAGAGAGLEVGAELRVFASGGREIRHPTTGELLGTTETQVGRLRVLEILPQVAIAEVVEANGDIGPGAIVRR